MVRHLGSGPARRRQRRAVADTSCPRASARSSGGGWRRCRSARADVLTTAAGDRPRVPHRAARGGRVATTRTSSTRSSRRASRAHVIAEVPGVYGRCSFTHALIRQTLYDGLTATRRARLHLRVAEALERLEADGAEPPLAELAHHFCLAPPARGAAKAVEYAERAARQRARRSSPTRRRRACTRSRCARSAQAAADGERRCELLLRLRRRADQGRRRIDGARGRSARPPSCARALGSPRSCSRWPRSATAPRGQMAGGVVDEARRAHARGGAGGGRRRRPGAARAAARAAGDGAQLLRAARAPRRAQRRGGRASPAASATPSGLGFALVARHWSLWGPGNVQERLAGRQRPARPGRELGRRAAGDAGPPLADDRPARARRHGRRRHRDRRLRADRRAPPPAVRRPVRAHLPRDAAAVRRRVRRRPSAEGNEAARVGERVQDTNTGNATLLQALHAAARARRGSSGSRARSRYYAERFGTIPGWRCVLAWLLAETGRARRGARDPRRLRGRRVPRAAARRDLARRRRLPRRDRGRARRRRRTPRRCTTCSSRTPTATWRSAGRRPARARRRATSACSPTCWARRDEAIAHFETALAMNERMRARPWVVHTQLELAARARAGARPTASAPPSCSSRASPRRGALGMARVLVEARSRADRRVHGSTTRSGRTTAHLRHRVR